MPDEDAMLIKYDPAEQEIRTLAERAKNLTCSDETGYMACRAIKKECVSIRSGYEKTRKELKASALAWGRKVDSEAKKYTEMVLEVEAPIAAMIKEVDDRRAAEAKAIADAAQREIDERNRLAREAEEAERKAKIAAERKELDAQREELRKAEEERQKKWAEKQKADAEEARQYREKQKAEREAQQAEQARMKAELDAQRAALEEQQAAMARANEEVLAKVREAEQEALRIKLLPDREKAAEYLRTFDSTFAPPSGMETPQGLAVATLFGHEVQAAASKLYAFSRGK